jgi:hypothetical protein
MYAAGFLGKKEEEINPFLYIITQMHLIYFYCIWVIILTSILYNFMQKIPSNCQNDYPFLFI